MTSGQPKRTRRVRKTPDATAFAREQRHRANEFAEALWQLLRNRQCGHKKFRREYPILPYTVDFCCVELKLVVEVDGDEHFTPEGRVYDQKRDEYLGGLGYKVLRIPGYDILRDSRSVIRRIEAAINECS
ncbi:endonuclease domain-containing protein [Roseimaritima ulvae]|uniref:DUF559 domain-containing protein n=1 Tax=Roseimaritima ulvae TaxID=980254 RepID=A0A5B9R010_9BACT|nr:endonuclease domain-containing protein [Roseimaritima ulvae]QEG43055.1 hypothetical protein UC8_50980 [Roseimaritima ulvae]